MMSARTSIAEVKRARWYLETIVKPTVAACVARQADVRLGILAALSLDNFVEYIFWTIHPARDGRGKSLKRYRGILAECSEFYAVVREIATASKHVELDVHNAARIEPPTLEAIQSRNWETCGLGHGARPHGTMPGTDGMFRHRVAFVRLREGPEWVLHGVVQEAMWFLTGKLAELSG
jgi:hypothetical protein